LNTDGDLSIVDGLRGLDMSVKGTQESGASGGVGEAMNSMIRR
jgi:hypothetical protein